MIYKNQQIYLFVGIIALSAILVIGSQYQQYSFGQAKETSTSTEQTFASGFDTFVSSEPTGYGMYEERESNVFAPGETFLLYVEPVGYSYGNMTSENGDQL